MFSLTQFRQSIPQTTHKQVIKDKTLGTPHQLLCKLHQIVKNHRNKKSGGGQDVRQKDLDLWLT